MNEQADYSALIQTMEACFGERLKLIVLFGLRSRGNSRPSNDHDIFVVIEGLPQDPLARQRTVMGPLLPVLLRLPEQLSLIAKTPEKLLANLTPSARGYLHGRHESVRAGVFPRHAKRGHAGSGHCWSATSAPGRDPDVDVASASQEWMGCDLGGLP